MPTHDLRTRLRSEAPLVVANVITASPVVVEAMAGAPFPALCFDMEHSTLNAAAVEGLLRAADVAGKPVLVRVPEIGADIQRVLDAGAAGIIVPQVETAAQAREVVERARFAPEGRRGLGVTRGSVYGAGLASPGYPAETNARTLVAIQIESVTGVAAADEILATPGIDAVVIGPGDLSSSLGVPLGAPAFWEAVDTVYAAAAAHGVAAGSFAFRPDHVREFASRHTGLLLVGSDLGWIMQGAAAEWDGIKRSFAAATVGASA